MTVSSLSARNFGKILGEEIENGLEAGDAGTRAGGKVSKGARAWGFLAPLLLIAGIYSIIMVAMTLSGKSAAITPALIVHAVILSVIVLLLVFMFRRFREKRNSLSESLVVSTLLLVGVFVIEFILWCMFLFLADGFSGSSEGIYVAPFLLSMIAGIIATTRILRDSPKKQKPDRNPAEEEYQ
jgi:lysylphosphatidylglycerol synthetase-like protein (DUF2156 family)